MATPSVASKIRCSTDHIKTTEVTFPADTAAGAFCGVGGNAYSRSFVGMAMHTVDISDDAVGVICYAAERIVATTVTWHRWTAGDKVYFDGTNNNFTQTATDMMLAGIALEGVAAGCTELEIELAGSLLTRAIT